MHVEEKHGAGVEQARQMLDVFSSLGVGEWDVTWTDLQGHKRCYRGGQSAAAVERQMPAWLRLAMERRQNLIVRPRGAPVQLVQLDDLRGAPLERVWKVAFLILSTSAGNQQAWVAVGDRMPDLGRRLRQGSGADGSASGATRVAGSVNFKPQYAPEFPTVQILAAARRRVVSSDELEAAGLLAPPYPPPEPLAVPCVRPGCQGRARAWPSYERCLQQAPLTQDGRRADISRVDFTFCLLAADWGWSVAETCQRLREKSSKARENGEGYVWRTAQRAAAVIARRAASRS
jgi:RepB DNA-primase from phage plasmid